MCNILENNVEVGMHVNKGKMKLGKTHVLFLGYDIHEGRFSLDSYVEVQRKYFPKFLREVRFVECWGYSIYVGRHALD